MDVVLLQNFPFYSHKALSVYLSNIAYELARISEINLTVISTGDQEQLNNYDFKIITTKGNPYSFFGNLTYTFQAAKIIKKLKKKQNIDIIHGLYPLSSIAAINLSRIKKQSKIIYELRSPWLLVGKAIGTVPFALSNLYLHLASFIEKILMKKSDGFIFITEDLHKFYGMKLPKEYDHLVIPSGINLEIFSIKEKKIDIRKKFNLEKDTTILGYIGSLEHARELDQVVKYIAAAIKTDLNLVFVLVGDGDGKEKMQAKAKELGIEDKVIFVPPVFHTEIPYWISEFDVCISHIADIPVYRPSFPLKILEFAALNKPILATAILPHKNFLEEYGNGKLYSDQQSFVSNLKEIIDGNTSMKEKFDITNYSYQKLAERIYSFYETLLK
jgi:glycosyltransferase involved in cell wall biosynthesis